MNSAFFKWSSNDLLRGLVVAVLGAIFAWLAQAFNAPGFDFATFQWDELLKVAFGAFVAYMSKNLLSTSDGKVFGKIG
jgi:hypothetical protein